MDTKQIISGELLEAKGVLDTFLADERNLEQIQEAAQGLLETIKNGGKIMSCGNGGSHADAMHFAEELTGRFRDDRKPIAALAISDPAHISCVGNDFGFEEIFARYVLALGKSEDTLLGISTSGNSENVVNAFLAAREMGIKTVALTGNDGGKLGLLADIEIRVPHFGYSDRIQEVHIKVIHILILLIEQGLKSGI